jgi:hypothetical protein
MVNVNSLSFFALGARCETVMDSHCSFHVSPPELGIFKGLQQSLLLEIYLKSVRIVAVSVTEMPVVAGTYNGRKFIYTGKLSEIHICRCTTS